MGWENNAVFQVLIIQGSTGSGLFVYSPSPGLGNLVGSIAAVSGTDLYGNAYLAGITDYSGGATPSAVQLLNGIVTFASAPAPGGPFTSLGQIKDTIWSEPVGSSISLESGLGGAQLVVAQTLITAAVPLHVSGSTNANVLSATNTLAAPTSPTAQIIAAAAADKAFGIDVTGDTNNRFVIDSNGQLSWGPGNAVQDTTLSRSGVGTLSAVALSAAAAGGNVLQVTNTTAAPSGASTRLIAAAAADRLLAGQVTGDTVTRWLVDSNGKMNWGPGGATAQDTDLFRGAVGVLQTDSTLAITNQATPATLAGAAQLYAASGQPAYKNPAGLTNNLSGATLATVNTVAVTQTTFTNLTQATIPAADAEVGATYELTAYGFGTWGSTQQQLTLGARFGAAATNTVGSTPAIAATAFAASAAFQWKATVTAVCVTTGATGTWAVSIEGTVTQTANALLPGTAADNTVPFASGTGSTDITLDTTVAEILGISALWASTTGAPTISKHISSFRRVA